MVFGVALLVVIGFLARLFYLQTSGGAAYRKAAYVQRRRAVEVAPARGTIYDRNKNALALSITVNSCYVFPQEIPEENRKETAELLAYILHMERSEVLESLASKKQYLRLKEQLTEEEIKQLKSSGLRSISIVLEPKRYYPEGDLFSQTVGFLDNDGKGSYGIEASYDRLLRGDNGKNIQSMDLSGNIIPAESPESFASVNGQDIYLTLDQKIQEIAAQELERGCKEFQAESGTVIVMDPNNGEVLSMVSYPRFDANKPRVPLSDVEKAKWNSYSDEERLHYLYSIWKNPAVSAIYEPGSVFKTLTSSIALENRSNTPSTIYVCHGSIEIAPGVRIHCWKYPLSHGAQTMEEALVHSCNPAFVQIVRDIGAKNFYSYLQSLRVSGMTGIDLPGETASSMPRNLEEMTGDRMATMSYGHGVAVTPIEMISAANTAINGGYYRPAHLYRESVDGEGKSLAHYNNQLGQQVFSQETSDVMRGYLRKVVEGNKSPVTRIHQVQVGGKSGTTLIQENGKYTDQTIASFFGFYPLEKPKYSVLVVIHKPQKSTFGDQVAGEITARIMERMLPQQSQDSNAEAETLVRTPNLMGMTVQEADRELRKVGLDLSVYGDMSFLTRIDQQTPKAGVPIRRGGRIQVKPKETPEYVIPDFQGKTREQLEKDYQDCGLKLQVDGQGKAVRQQPAAGEVVEKNHVVHIYLEEEKESGKEQGKGE